MKRKSNNEKDIEFPWVCIDFLLMFFLIIILKLSFYFNDGINNKNRWNLFNVRSEHISYMLWLEMAKF